MSEDTMKDVDHTHPFTDEPFGTVYRRGPAVADGGERAVDAAEPAGTAASSTENVENAATTERRDRQHTMRSVDHTPREGDGANEVWNRGHGDVDE